MTGWVRSCRMTSGRGGGFLYDCVWRSVHGVWHKGQIVGTDGSLIKDVMKDVTDGNKDMSAAELIWRVFTEKK